MTDPAAAEPEGESASVEARRQEWSRAWRQRGVGHHDPELPWEHTRVLTEALGLLRSRRTPLRMIDLGAGRGAVGEQARRALVRVSGKPVRLVSVDSAQLSPIDRSTHLQAAVEHVPAKDHRFDVAMLSLLLEYLTPTEQATALRELYRVLTPRGLAVLFFHHPDSRLSRSLRGRVKRDAFPAIAQTFSPLREPEIRQLLGQAGFTVLELEPSVSPSVPNDVDRVIGVIARKAKAYHLTDREYDVLRLVAQGLSNREIAAALGITRKTVRVHLGAISKKLRLTGYAPGPTGRHLLLRTIYREGLEPPPVGYPEAIQRARKRLSPLQEQIFELAMEAVSYQAMAGRVGVSFSTIRSSVERITKKLASEFPEGARINLWLAAAIAGGSREAAAASEQGRGATDLVLFVGVAFAFEGLLWLLGGWIAAALGLPILALIVMRYRLNVQPERERLHLEAAKSVSDTTLVPDADNDEAVVNEAERWAGEATNPHLTRPQAREALIRAMNFADVFLAEEGDSATEVGGRWPNRLAGAAGNFPGFEDEVQKRAAAGQRSRKEPLRLPAAEELGPVVVEVGPGRGSLAKELVIRGLKVFGVDPDPDVRERLAELDRQLPDFTFIPTQIQGWKAEELTEPVNTVLVAFPEPFNFWLERNEWAAAIGRLLQSRRGQLLVVTEIPPDSSPFGAFKEALERVGLETHSGLVPAEVLMQRLPGIEHSIHFEPGTEHTVLMAFNPPQGPQPPGHFDLGPITPFLFIGGLPSLLMAPGVFEYLAHFIHSPPLVALGSRLEALGKSLSLEPSALSLERLTPLISHLASFFRFIGNLLIALAPVFATLAVAFGLAKPPLPRRSGGFGRGESSSSEGGNAPLGGLPVIPFLRRRSRRAIAAMTSVIKNARSAVERDVVAMRSELWRPWRSRAPPMSRP